MQRRNPRSQRPETFTIQSGGREAKIAIPEKRRLWKIAARMVKHGRKGMLPAEVEMLALRITLKAFNNPGHYNRAMLEKARKFLSGAMRICTDPKEINQKFSRMIRTQLPDAEFELYANARDMLAKHFLKLDEVKEDE